MFVRRIRSRNSICFQIGYKKSGKFVLTKHVGCGKTIAEIEALKAKAQSELRRILFDNQLSLFPNLEDKPVAKLLNWHISGFHQVFGAVYDRIGFPNNLLRDLVIARIVYPKSKTATVRYLDRYLGVHVSKDRIYRFLDTLGKDTLTKIAYDFVCRKRDGVSLVFYDVTTLYFETEENTDEADLRKRGYSKDHRIDTPQILIGLFVDAGGFPFDFDFFKGSSFEGHTFQISIENLTQKYNLNRLTVVADAGMLSDDNLSFLEEKYIDYIVGARLRSASGELKDHILHHDFTAGSVYEHIDRGRRFIVDYSEKRAKRDQSNREKQIKKLELNLKSGKRLIRRSKYLLMEGAGKVLGVDRKKAEEDSRLDGLKGYLTTLKNTVSGQEIITQYHNLWKIEKAFRMSKNDLRERPVYHQNLKRVAAHLMLCFVSLLVMKESERILHSNSCSLEKAIEVLGKVGQGQMRLGNTSLEIDSELDQETKSILGLFTGH